MTAEVNTTTEIPGAESSSNERGFAPITGAAIGTNIKNSVTISSIFIILICSALLFVLRSKEKSDKKKAKKKTNKKDVTN